MSEYCYKYPRPALTTDILIFAYENKKLFLLLIKRKHYPFEGQWALPGGFTDIDETVEQCAVRELYEETGIKNITPEILTVMSEPQRDPRGRTVSVVFWTLIKNKKTAIAGDDAKEVNWFELNNLPSLAFDHEQIVSIAKEKLLEKLNPTFLNNKNLDNNLTINDLKNIYYYITQ